LKIPFIGRKNRDAYMDKHPWQRRIHDRVLPYTMTGSDRIYAMIDAVEYLVRANIGGAFVECGVWRGGSMMAGALTLGHLNALDRKLFLFDTFSGMTDPTETDVDLTNVLAKKILDGFRRKGQAWCGATKDEVQANMSTVEYPLELIELVEGDVLATIPSRAPQEIALLRLDTDWYESTKHELDHLYQRVLPGGVVIIDDYGHWQGAKKAVDEFLEQHGLSYLLHRIDYTGRMFVKR
jgi:O-methyltransferase